VTPHPKWPLTGLAVVALLLVLVIGAIAWRALDHDERVSAPDVQPTRELLARGKYLTQAADCAACHQAPGGRPFAGGLAFKLPFGTVYSTNITADLDTGIGRWTDDNFVRALHQGIARNGENLYPAMPYTSYTGMSRDDAVAIKAYLFSLPAVSAPHTPNRLSFPFNQRWALGLWNLAFLKEKRFAADPAASPQARRGAYLATALGHCGECHTPRNAGFGLKAGEQFAGATLSGWRAYNITPDASSGIGGWTGEALAEYLATGHAAGHGTASGPMGEAVENSLRYLTPQDTAALVVYLRQLAPQSTQDGIELNPAPAPSALASAWAPGPRQAGARHDDLGRRLFAGDCASCHAWNGQGQQSPSAALAGSRTVNDPEGVNLTQVLLHGTGQMPSFGKAYSDTELAAVSNYVIGHFAGKTGQVSAADIGKRRKL
jgi:mono/diheme cytochrome c family protein